MVPTGPRQFCIFCHLCNAIAVCKSVHQNSPAIPVSFSHKTSNICKRKYFALHGPVLFKTFTECHFGKHVFSPDNRDFSAMLGLFKSRIKRLVALIYHVWATKWNIYFGSGNHILEILKGLELFKFKILFRSSRSTSNDKRSRAHPRCLPCKNILAKHPGATLQSFMRGGSAPKSNSGPLYPLCTILTEKVPLPYTDQFHWKKGSRKVPLSQTYLLGTLHTFSNWTILHSRRI